jgi:hypothetical protein
VERTQKVVALFRDRFVQREDCYPLQRADGHYGLVRGSLTDGAIVGHLKGKHTIGLYPAPAGTTKWICIDIDILEPAAVLTARERLGECEIPYLTEFSGNKGFHLWVFFSQPSPNRIARSLGQAITSDHEVFPKQDQIPPIGYGNFVKAPLGIHQVTKDWCLFVNDDLTQLENPYEVLESVQTIDPTQTIKEKFPEEWDRINQRAPGPAVSSPRGTREISRPPFLKDCLQQQLREGTQKGKRNKVGHILASELRSTGLPKNQTYQILSRIWNPHNQPPLAARELHALVNAAYTKGSYEYGCRPDGPLRQNVTCLGTDTCAYYSVLKTQPRMEDRKP